MHYSLKKLRPHQALPQKYKYTVYRYRGFNGSCAASRNCFYFALIAALSMLSVFTFLLNFDSQHIAARGVLLYSKCQIAQLVGHHDHFNVDSFSGQSLNQQLMSLS